MLFILFCVSFVIVLLFVGILLGNLVYRSYLTAIMNTSTHACLTACYGVPLTYSYVGTDGYIKLVI